MVEGWRKVQYDSVLVSEKLFGSHGKSEASVVVGCPHANTLIIGELFPDSFRVGFLKLFNIYLLYFEPQKEIVVFEPQIVVFLQSGDPPCWPC